MPSLLLIATAIMAGVAIGEIRYSFTTVMQVAGNQLFNMDYPVSQLDTGIIWDYRLTRALVAACCGAGLALSGVVLQSLLRNNLADPYILGISAGASTGAVLVAVMGLGAGMVSLSSGAFVGALLAFAVVALLAKGAAQGTAQYHNGHIVLAGIASCQLFNALTALVIAKSANSDQARGIMFWLLGNLSGVRWDDVTLALPMTLAGLIVCLLYTRPLDAFTFGQESAAALGIPVRQTQTLLIAAAALMTAAMVAIVGAIGFVGLVIPHAARFLVGSQHGRLVPMSALIGAVFLVCADIASRIIIPGQVLPIGVITALIGAPVFALLLIRGQSK
ncbi:FecCD family ABC transporter permease [Terasakiispira papahanaumokuakeensis]|uniref:FecCD family ABC transporter permease n=1 Tax=Terasakiispira papahanaumokuakeensis TaxID=197479 RepID=UPI003CCBA783